MKGLAGGMNLPAHIVDQILEYSTRYSDSHTGHWDCDAIRQIAFDPFILEVTKQYLGTEPVVHSSYVYWSNPHKQAAPYPEKFHYDVADFKSLCVYFYITDVDEDSGAHVAVEGTHRRKNIFQLMNPFMPDDTAATKYGSRVRVFTGPRGTGFFEDQVCLHKRLIPKRRRLALIVNYTLQRQAEDFDTAVKQNIATKTPAPAAVATV